MAAQDLTTSVWGIEADDFPSTASITEQTRFLLQYAILAPSSHNSQPWQFQVSDNEVRVSADESRWLDAADPNKRELYISLGCAVENLCIAATHFGFDVTTDYHDPTTAEHVATVTLDSDGEPATRRPPSLFEEISKRSTSHDPFADQPLSAETRDALQSVVFEDDVTLHLIDDPERKGALSELQAEADRLLMEDPAYRRELGHWIGLGALGNSWLMARIGQAVVTHLDLGDREAAKNSALIDSAPVVAVLTTDADDPRAQVRTGQVFERIALQASAAGVATHPMSQTLERPDLRSHLAELLGETAARPQHLFRVGYTDESGDHTPRWPLETFLIEP